MLELVCGTFPGLLPTWPVGGGHDEHLFARLQSVHLGQQLVDHPHAGT